MVSALTFPCIFIHIHPHIHPFTLRCIFTHLRHAFIGGRNHHQQHQSSCFEMLSRQLLPFTVYSSIFIHIFIHLRHAAYLSTYATLSMAAETTASSTRARVLRCYQGSFVRSLFFSCLESCYQGSFVRGLFFRCHESCISDCLVLCYVTCDVFGHIILDHVSLISHYSETHACGIVHET